ncbi:beta-ketoacyl synthase N-terminal-like domain-containing protein [Kitasatospora sp. NA04385]|uniref:beta-ketoacyl synthase N-terminal-like domain-containing protein n=1 Tax=Kitasatospora sp. NA04385 TaxID=2742135 RepID=UPI001C37A3D1|nr:beta-ketoacyl synthase N-terminal-like domain-containing protein [Kitasatospora sp. NA04385]
MAGLRVLSSGQWPESVEDRGAPGIAGFVVSSFSPLAAEAARRCLLRRPDPSGGAGRPVTAVVVVSPLGDLAGAAHVAEAVDGGARIGPLLFFQAVPNAVAGHVAARWQLTGPVVCVADTATATAVAALLLADGDAGEALLIRVDQAHTPGGPDRAAAVLLGPGPGTNPGSRPGPEPQLHEGEQP